MNCLLCLDKSHFITGDKMKYLPLENKSALNKVTKRGLPYNWDLNIYRGCYHRCIYCFALYTHDYIGTDSFYDTVYYKRNILALLEKELSSPKWKREIVNIGGITDSYQPVEAKLKIMPEVLKLMIKYKTPIIISTKSALILRDIDLIKELASITYVNIACTITTLDNNISQWIEPGASLPMHRFQVLKKIKEETKAYVGLHLMPIIPNITDSSKNLETIYHLASDIKVDYVLPGTLYLRGKTRTHFFNALKHKDLNLYYQLYDLYKKPLSKDFKTALYSRINTYKKKYNVTSNYTQLIKKHKDKE